MRVINLCFIVLLGFILFSCKKDKCEKKFCKMYDSIVCDDKRFDDKDAVKPDHYIDKDGNKVNCKIDKYILSPIVKDDECGYIISGKIKYVIDDKTAAIIDYGDGEIDPWAVKAVYYYDKDKVNSNCKKDWDKGKHIKCCKFKQKCIKDTDPVNANVQAVD